MVKETSVTAEQTTAPQSSTQRAQADAAAQAERAEREASISAWDWFSLTCVRQFLRVGLALFGLRGLYKFCRGFGTLEYWINHKRRRRIRRMLTTVYCGQISRADMRRHIRAHVMRQRCDKAFYFLGDLLTTDQMRARFTISNRELLDAGLARGKGVYAMTSHHGAYHITGLTMTALGYRVAGIRDPNESPLRRYIQAQWSDRHSELPRPQVLYSGDFARQIYRLLRDNYALGSSLDVNRLRDTRLATVPVNIYGETRQFLTGTLQIALRCGATVIQAFMVAHDDFMYELRLLGPFTDPDTDRESPELLASVLQRYADNIEKHAREFPDQVMRA